ncbi:MAG: hypothetical protein SGPRY_012426, partial [Prymnesium sp.]
VNVHPLQELFRELSMSQFRRFVLDTGIVQGGYLAHAKNKDGTRLIKPIIMADTVKPFPS